MKEKNLDPYATRWTALLAEHSILHKEHIDLRSSFTPPFSVEQTVQLETSAARFGSLPPKIQQLVEDWATSYRSDDTRRSRALARRNRFKRGPTGIMG
jgi:hypothetical protein